MSLSFVAHIALGNPSICGRLVERGRKSACALGENAAFLRRRRRPFQCTHALELGFRRCKRRPSEIVRANDL